MKKFDHWQATKEEKRILELCRNVVQKLESNAEVILYGSRARGEAEPESDYDLLILVDGEVTLEREDFICRQLYPIELDTGKGFSAMVYSRQQWNTPLYRAMPFHKSIERDGLVL